ncbi:MAG: capsule assembly Wzi family protein [Bacteroidaceae bacterium]|nr:capsule assembly Wzi family protein [Bacteroidaceae bacterium]
MKKSILLTLALIGTLLPSNGLEVRAQNRLTSDIKYKTEISGQFGNGNHTPFWQSANRYGLANINNNSGYLRTSIQRDTEADVQRNWRIGYGADLIVPINYTSHFIVQQLYGEVQYKAVRLTVGQQELPLEMKNQALTSGGMVLGANARPIPQVRIELPDFLVFKRTNNWIGVKGSVAYGFYTDNQWQRTFNAGNKDAVFTANSRYHSKAGYLRIGNLDKFPVVLTGGVQMTCQFGGTVWNRKIKGEAPDGSYNLNGGITDYFKAFIPTGSDVTDGDNPNVMGNTVGSYLARVEYHGKGWKASIYGEHMFEDHSQMGWDFAWKDFLWGLEVELPQNPIVSTIVAEHMRTTDQSGPVLVAYGNKVPYIGGQDNYYNHNIYGSYQHAGFVMGNPLLLSPIYNHDGRIVCYDNRITAMHFGIQGNPLPDVSYRMLYTHEKSFGNFNTPHSDPMHGDFLLIESTYKPHQLPGISFTASYGMNHGKLLGNSNGGMLTVAYSNF